MWVLLFCGSTRTVLQQKFPMLSSQDNVRIAERLRPSNEQLAAQKGCRRLEMLLESALRHCKFDAVLIISLTGYVQELGLAVVRLDKLDNLPTFFDFENQFHSTSFGGVLTPSILSLLLAHGR